MLKNVPRSNRMLALDSDCLLLHTRSSISSLRHYNAKRSLYCWYFATEKAARIVEYITHICTAVYIKVDQHPKFLPLPLPLPLPLLFEEFPGVFKLTSLLHCLTVCLIAAGSYAASPNSNLT